MPDFTNFNSLVDVVLYFGTVEKCKETIAQARWKGRNTVCSYCEQPHCHFTSEKHNPLILYKK